MSNVKANIKISIAKDKVVTCVVFVQMGQHQLTLDMIDIICLVNSEF